MTDKQTQMAHLNRPVQLSPAEVNQRIWQMEEKCDLFQYRVEGWCAWPILRFAVAYALEGFSSVKQHNKMAWVRELVTAATQDIPRLVWLRPARYFCNTCTSCLAESENGLYKDIFLDDLLQEVDDYFKLEIINAAGFASRRKSALRKSNLTTTLFRLVAVVLARAAGPRYIGEIARHLSVCLHRELGLTIFTPRQIENQLREFYWQKKVYTWLLRRVRPEYLLKYDSSERGLVAAAKEQGITVVELQHGYFYPYHYAYSWPAWAVKYKPCMTIPDYLFLFGENTKKALEVNSFWGAELRVVGSARIDQYRWRRAATIQAEPCTLLFTTQGFDVKQTIAFMVEFWEAVRGQLDLRLYIKLHPVYDTDKAPYEVAFRTDPRVQVLLGSEGLSTFELMSQAHIHLSVGSSSHYEALALGVPTVILPFTFHDIMLPLHKAGHAFLARTPDELVDIVLKWKELEVSSDVAEYYFKVGALDNIKKELGVIQG